MFGFGKNYDNDPDQQKLILLILNGAAGAGFGEATRYLVETPWNGKETRNRIAHAVKAVRQVLPPDAYQRAKDFGWQITQSSYKLGF